MREKTYLGDGVYASFDGWQIWLSLDGQDDSMIALEPNVLERLNQFADRMYKPEPSETEQQQVKDE